MGRAFELPQNGVELVGDLALRFERGGLGRAAFGGGRLEEGAAHRGAEGHHRRGDELAEIGASEDVGVSHREAGGDEDERVAVANDLGIVAFFGVIEEPRGDRDHRYRGVDRILGDGVAELRFELRVRELLGSGDGDEGRQGAESAERAVIHVPGAP